MDQRVFAYWDGDPEDKIDVFLAEWRAAFPAFRLCGNAEVETIIAKYFRKYLDLFKDMTIPAAKSDIARLMILYEYGGLYIDCDCAIKDRAGVDELFDRFDENEAVLVRRASPKHDAMGELTFLNGIMMFQRRSILPFMIARQAFGNLEALREFETTIGRVPYGIAFLTGPTLLTSMMIQPGSQRRQVRQDFAGRVVVVEQKTSPIVPGEHPAKGLAKEHWLQRQHTEFLFRRDRR